MSKTIFLSAGEHSGDVHAARLAAEIKKMDPEASLAGIGGSHLASAGVRLFYRSDKVSIIGLFDVFRQFGRIREMFNIFLARAEEEKIDLAVLVDYPGFHLRLAKELKKRGIRVVYYISPQVWAWGKNRIKKIKECVEKILVLFKFEKELYEKAGVPVEWVGHPLVGEVKAVSNKAAVRENLRLEESKKTVALLPGSREREITTLLPAMAEAAQRLYEKSKDIQFIIVRSHNIEKKIYRECLNGLKAAHCIANNTGRELYDYLSVADLAIAASGTVTLECAIMGVPMVVTYKVSLFNAVVMRAFMRISTIGLVNILAGKKIVPELVQFDCTADGIFSEASKILFQSGESERIKKELAKVRQSLGEEGASRRAALSIIGD